MAPSTVASGFRYESVMYNLTLQLAAAAQIAFIDERKLLSILTGLPLGSKHPIDE
jgi:hypothetical protein